MCGWEKVCVFVTPLLFKEWFEMYFQHETVNFASLFSSFSSLSTLWSVTVFIHVCISDYLPSSSFVVFFYIAVKVLAVCQSSIIVYLIGLCLCINYGGQSVN